MGGKRHREHMTQCHPRFMPVATDLTTPQAPPPPPPRHPNQGAHRSRSRAKTSPCPSARNSLYSSGATRVWRGSLMG